VFIDLSAQSIAPQLGALPTNCPDPDPVKRWMDCVEEDRRRSWCIEVWENCSTGRRRMTLSDITEDAEQKLGAVLA